MYLKCTLTISRLHYTSLQYGDPLLIPLSLSKPDHTHTHTYIHTKKKKKQEWPNNCQVGPKTHWEIQLTKFLKFRMLHNICFSYCLLTLSILINIQQNDVACQKKCSLVFSVFAIWMKMLLAKYKLKHGTISNTEHNLLTLLTLN